MKLIFMGTPDFAVGILEALLAAGHEVALVVTQPDKPKGRGNVLQAPPVKEAALLREIPVFQPKKVRELENIKELRDIQPDAIIVAAFGQILPKEILELAPFGCINVHASLLPKYRGASPIQWAVLNGEKTSGVTIMRMDEGVDTGDIIAQREITLSPEETSESLFEKLSKLGAELLIETLPLVENGTATFTPQEDSEATHTGKIDKELGRINWTKSAEEIERLIRALPAYTYLDQKTLKIWRAELSAEPLPEEPNAGAPGTATAVKKGLLVSTGTTPLLITELQLEGKKRMEAGAFLRGYALAPGARLG